MSISTLLQKLLPSFRDTLQRFTLSCLAAFALAFLIMPSFELDDFLSKEHYGKAIYILSIGVLWFTSVRIFAESRSWSTVRELGLALIPWVALAILLFTSHNQVVIPLVLLSVGLAFIPIYAPYIGKNVKDCTFWSYNFELGGSLFFAAVSTVILCGGLCVGLRAIEKLFGVHIDWKAYGNIWTIGWTIYGVIYFLAGIPRDFNSSNETDGKEFPQAVRFIVTYMLVPLTLVYIGILYAYYAKILLTASLPKGILSNLTIAFCIVGIVSWLVALPLSETGVKAIRIFCRHFFKVLLIPAMVLAFAIGIRISEYGVTESRYVMVMAALWFGLCSAFYWRWEQRSIKFIPVSISVMFILAAFGPWSADSISMNSQLKRLEQFVISHKMLDEQGFLRKPEIEIDDKNNRNLNSILSYLTNNKVRAKKIAHYFPAKHSVHTDLKKEDFRGWETHDKIRLGLGIHSRSNDKSRTLMSSDKNSTIAISGYNFMIEFNMKQMIIRDKYPSFKIDEKEYFLKFDGININLANKLGKNQYKFDVRKNMAELNKAYKDDHQSVAEKDDHLLMFKSNLNVNKAKMVFKTIIIKDPGNLNPNFTTNIERGNGYILFEKLPK